MIRFDPFNDFPIEDILRYWAAFVIVASGIIAIGYSIWWGLLLITSGWNEEKVKPAVNYIRHAIFGIVVLLVIIFVAPVIARIIGLDFPDALRPNSIFSTMREVSLHFFGWSTTNTDVMTDPTTGTVGTDFTNL